METELISQQLPYVGITDFTSCNQALELVSLFEAHNAKNHAHILRRRLMVGVMMSYKTMHGIPTRQGWENIWPRKEAIGEIFFDHPLLMNCIHYVDYDNMPDLAETLIEAECWGGAGLSAIQLDMVWPSTFELKRYRAMSTRKTEIVLQVSVAALERVGNDLDRLTCRLDEYCGLVDFVLLDWSSGTGRKFDQSAIPYVQLLSRLPYVQLALGGGFGPDALSFFADQLAFNPSLSIDAQSKLRESGSAVDPVNWSLARAYVVHALAAVSLA